MVTSTNADQQITAPDKSECGKHGPMQLHRSPTKWNGRWALEVSARVKGLPKAPLEWYGIVLPKKCLNVIAKPCSSKLVIRSLLWTPTWVSICTSQSYTLTTPKCREKCREDASMSSASPILDSNLEFFPDGFGTEPPLIRLHR